MVNAGQWRELERYWQGEADVNPLDTLKAFHFQHQYDVSSWSVKLVNYTLGCIMARGKGNTSASDADKKAGWTQFVDIPMTGVTWKDVEHELGDSDTVANAVSSLCQSGYRVGVSYNTGNDAFIVSVTCRNDDSPNSGKTFTAFAGTWWEALQVAVFKHYFVAREIWPAPTERKLTSSFG